MTTFDPPTLTSQADFKRSQALCDIIRQEIIKQGPLSFAQFMEFALYHPELGYYNAETLEIGALGDFTTAAQISPLYAACFGNQVLQIFTLLPQKNILEIGAGTGQFALDLLNYLEKQNILPDHYYIFERSPALQKKQQLLLQQHCPHLLKIIKWLPQLPIIFQGIIIANEVLDAFPFHCFKISKNGVKEKCVGLKQNELAWIYQTPKPELEMIVNRLIKEFELINNYESEVNLAVAPFVNTLTHILSQGVIFFADYGYGEKEYYRKERICGTMTSFYKHTHDDEPLIFPGLKDITAHVNFTQIIESAKGDCTLAGYTSQAGFLLGNGLTELVIAEETHLTEIEKFQLHQQIKTLMLPSEMGEVIKVMAISKNINLKLKGFQLEDRRREL